VAATFAQFDFVRVIFVAAIAAIILQCLVYGVRHALGIRIARIVHRASLAGFAAIAVFETVSARIGGQLESATSTMGAAPLMDFALFIVFTMFISFFMGERYLSDQEERAERKATKADRVVDAQPTDNSGKAIEDA
jgi:hypothetical protein